MLLSASSSLSTGNDNDQLGVVVTYVVKVSVEAKLLYNLAMSVGLQFI